LKHLIYGKLIELHKEVNEIHEFHFCDGWLKC
jgi:hypothetical protein